jgi:ketopantoate reductase
MKVGVIGSGAMGTIFGLAMARSGHDVLFYDVRPDLIAAIDRLRRSGLRSLSGAKGAAAAHRRLTQTPQNNGPQAIPIRPSRQTGGAP